MTTLNRIGILAHPLRPQTAPVAEHIAATLQARGVETWVKTMWDETARLPMPQSTDMVIAIGGDGAMLRAARACARHGVPVLGVNMGRLGFLTEVTNPEDWDEALDHLLGGESWIETRMMLHATVERAGERIAGAESLNEIVISRSIATRMVQLEAYIDGGWTTTYHADALIVATPTGSTAYALASGGPILPPELRNILLVPVAPHLSLDRPIVLQEGAVVTVRVLSESDTALTADGTTVAELRTGDRVIVQRVWNDERQRLSGVTSIVSSLAKLAA